MQKQNPIDDLFRSELADYKVGPSDERRAAFMREAGEKPGKRLWSLWWLIGIVGLVFIGIGVAVLVRDEKREVRVDRSLALARYERDGKSVNNTKVIGKANENAANKKNNIRESINKTTSTQGNKNELIASANQMPALGGAAIIPLGGTATMAAAVEPAPQAAEEVGEVLDVKGIGEPAETKQPPEPAVIPGAPKDEQNKSTVKPETQNEEKEATYRDNSHLPKKWNISTGVYYTPEWMFNTLNGDKFVNNFGVEGTFHFGRYSVRTGFGLS
ncbi:MAG: hypothetical protein NTY96_03870, partial [Bacteroidetes bacterium]|nr:hypothetical protein [Bacteroidota bacterium]